MLLALLPYLELADQDSSPQPDKPHTQVFLLRPRPLPAPASHILPDGLTLSTLENTTPQTPAFPDPDLEVDINSIQLSFAADVANQLPGVVERQRGAFALLDKADPAIARYLFSPPNWDAREIVADVSSKLRILMDPPQKWTLLRELAERHSISLDRYQACALFEIAYRRCLQDAIRRQALSVARESASRVSAARLAFAADRPCGIQVLEVSLAPVHTP